MEATLNEEFNLVERCLAGDAEAIGCLQETYRGGVARFLSERGLTSLEAEEAAHELWADLLMPGPDCCARISRYQGRSSLQTWLNAVALNKVLSRKRKEERWSRLVPERLYGTADQQERTLGTPHDGAEIPNDGTDDALLDLLLDALRAGFGACTAEEWVLLELAHRGGLQRKELARLWGMGAMKVTEELDRIERVVAARTLQRVHEVDPWLDLRWEDFSALCPVLAAGDLAAVEGSGRVESVTPPSGSAARE